ncbi:unnamed protein product [Sphenostylis stenocarpa]|uniref:Secreted protein n=1 Tax=Sphenostylis stenocarpa TaxID=92480 RepID=A0AA86SLY5_9FABA|nr:unnamed protein product [Sphenostylis stenocarpa]
MKAKLLSANLLPAFVLDSYLSVANSAIFKQLNVLLLCCASVCPESDQHCPNSARWIEESGSSFLIF